MGLWEAGVKLGLGYHPARRTESVTAHPRPLASGQRPGWGRGGWPRPQAAPRRRAAACRPPQPAAGGGAPVTPAPGRGARWCQPGVSGVVQTRGEEINTRTSRHWMARTRVARHLLQLASVVALVVFSALMITQVDIASASSTAPAASAQQRWGPIQNSTLHRLEDEVQALRARLAEGAAAMERMVAEVAALRRVAVSPLAQAPAAAASCAACASPAAPTCAAASTCAVAPTCAAAPACPPSASASPLLVIDPPPGSPFAYVTMASGDAAARNALALFQSLRSMGTGALGAGVSPDLVLLVPMVVGLPSTCFNFSWKAQVGREHIECSLPKRDAPEKRHAWVPEEVFSPHLTRAMRALGARFVVFEPFPLTEWTDGISGGPGAAWGNSLYKLVVFNLTQYKKVVFMDADTMAVANLDHLFGPETTHFSTAVTEACCNANAPGIPSGGFWVLEPSLAEGRRLWQLMVEGDPKTDSHGAPVINAATGAQERDKWTLSDLALIQAAYAIRERDVFRHRYWPWVNDKHHGYVPGVRAEPMFAAMSDAQFVEAMFDTVEKQPMREGFQASRVAAQDERRPLWHALSVAYDQCVSVCDCAPWRWPAVDSGFTKSVHFR